MAEKVEGGGDGWKRRTKLIGDSDRQRQKLLVKAVSGGGEGQKQQLTASGGCDGGW